MSVSFRSVTLPENVAGRLYFHSMPGRYEPLQAVWNELAARRAASNGIRVSGRRCAPRTAAP